MQSSLNSVCLPHGKCYVCVSCYYCYVSIVIDVKSTLFSLSYPVSYIGVGEKGEKEYNLTARGGWGYSQGACADTCCYRTIQVGRVREGGLEKCVILESTHSVGPELLNLL